MAASALSPAELAALEARIAEQGGAVRDAKAALKEGGGGQELLLTPVALMLAYGTARASAGPRSLAHAPPPLRGGGAAGAAPARSCLGGRSARGACR